MDNVELIKLSYEVLGYKVIILEQRFLSLVIVIYLASDHLQVALAFQLFHTQFLINF